MSASLRSSTWSSRSQRDTSGSYIPSHIMLIIAREPFYTHRFFTNIILTPTSPSQITYSYCPTLASSSPSPSPSSRVRSRSLPVPKPPPCHTLSQWRWQRQHKDLFVDTFHQNHQLRKLLFELSNKESDPLRLLNEHDDWGTEQFWLVVKFLLEEGRVEEVLQVFGAWTGKERSRINTSNYTRLIQLISEEGSLEKAITALKDMEGHGLVPSVVIYSSVVSGFAKNGDFESAKDTIRKIRKVGLMPVPETYNGLIRAYGERGMYDEMSKCVKRMGFEGCLPNEVTYNLLIAEFAKGRLFERMEGVCRTLTSKRMNLLSSTLVVMLEAYADMGILDKMERVYRRVLVSKGFLKENLIRKMANVYIENYRFVRLEEFGNEISSMTGKTFLVWCLLLLASACLTSRKGMDSILREMEIANVTPNITFTNILALTSIKIKDFRNLENLLCGLGEKNIKPDMVTIGVLFDACRLGYDGTRALEIWKRSGFLDEVAEMKTDPLVLSAFGKGSFLQCCEKLYTALRAEEKEKNVWRYSNLLRLVFGSGGRKAHD